MVTLLPVLPVRMPPVPMPVPVVPREGRMPVVGVIGDLGRRGCWSPR
ncbi:hypothetical protein [Microbispora sp. H11081]|nr:hypothetical protein [Microbispora sp. H11081]